MKLLLIKDFRAQFDTTKISFLWTQHEKFDVIGCHGGALSPEAKRIEYFLEWDRETQAFTGNNWFRILNMLINANLWPPPPRAFETYRNPALK